MAATTRNAVRNLLERLEDRLLLSAGYSLRFFGNGTGDIDRVKIPIDPHNAVDVGGDFTVEFWMKARAADNGGSVSTGGDGWITGNIIFDRDVFGPGDHGDWGIALGGGHIALGVDDGSSGETVVGSIDVDDDTWHHVAVTRDQSSGSLRIYVDGSLDAQRSGPTGDVSYRNGRATSYPNSDPFLVIAAEKHDAGGGYPSYAGYLDEVRVSDTVRYSGNFTPSTAPLAADTGTVALYHFDEGSGTNAADEAGNSDGTLQVGGSPSGPLWSADTPIDDASGRLGVFRTGSWYFDTSGDGAWSGTGGGGDTAFQYGIALDQAVAGDWNGDSLDEIGVFRGGYWFLDHNGNGAWDGADGGDVQYQFGGAGDVAVAGDWNNDGTDEIGVFRAGTWYTDDNGNGAWDGVPTDGASRFGNPGDLPVVGQWADDGIDRLGVFRGAGIWYTDTNGDRGWSGAGPDDVLQYGIAGDRPLADDWDGDGTAEIGVFRGGRWFLDATGDNLWNGVAGGDLTHRFGTVGDQPIVGRWHPPAGMMALEAPLAALSVDVVDGISDSRDSSPPRFSIRRAVFAARAPAVPIQPAAVRAIALRGSAAAWQDDAPTAALGLPRRISVAAVDEFLELLGSDL